MRHQHLRHDVRRLPWRWQRRQRRVHLHHLCGGGEAVQLGAPLPAGGGDAPRPCPGRRHACATARPRPLRRLLQLRPLAARAGHAAPEASQGRRGERGAGAADIFRGHQRRGARPARGSGTRRPGPAGLIQGHPDGGGNVVRDQGLGRGAGGADARAWLRRRGDGRREGGALPQRRRVGRRGAWGLRGDQRRPAIGHLPHLPRRGEGLHRRRRCILRRASRRIGRHQRFLARLDALRLRRRRRELHVGRRLHRAVGHRIGPRLVGGAGAAIAAFLGVVSAASLLRCLST
mmetsp:Transcript_92978/g.259881  ORF Transcript_92978/g.259881 Transcript_92978/m.259881 type:complete len:289 (-) Transcript_92978:32-898(-)